MARYALTIFFSAFLLFQVQPLIAKYILPWFGGGPSIWTTCMLFFQTLLVGGYLYAHLLTDRFTPRRQGLIHLGVVILSLILLPISPSEHFKPTGSESPVGGILLLLLITVGGPYFLLASTGPLMQKWFSRSYPERSPYRLYSLSNVGSLLALLSYPIVVEPMLKLQTQVWIWSATYAAFAALAVWCSIRIAGDSTEPAAESIVPDAAESTADAQSLVRPGLLRMLLWLGLSATGSAMMLATTNQMCLDVAAVPFLWVLPLALYLLTFVICFDNPRWYDRRVFGLLLVTATAVLCWQMSQGLDTTVPTLVTIYSTGMFACCMTCHGELVRSRPHPRYLTLYYLLVSVGGTLGGLFVAVIAPIIFTGFFEYHIALFAVCAMTLSAWCVNRVWTTTGSSVLWTWIAVSAAQGAIMYVMVYRPHVEYFLDSEALLFFCVLGLIHVVGWVVTAARERQPIALAVTWAIVTAGQMVWVIWFVESRLFGALTAGQYALLSIISVFTAAAGFVVVRLVDRWISDRSWRCLLIIAMQAVLLVGLGLLTGYGEISGMMCTALLSLYAGLNILVPVAGRVTRFKALQTFSASGVWFWAPAVTACVLLGMGLVQLVNEDEVQPVYVSRNFYGVLRVTLNEDDNGLYHTLTHGQIEHGNQYLSDDWRNQPTTYYGPGTGVEMALRLHPRRRATDPQERGLRVGVAGLGAGSIAALGTAADTLRFYEINPDVLTVSETYFTYLSDSPAQTKVVLGDARIMLDRELASGGSQQFDVIAVDAFSSDSIPIHLITRESVDLYRKHLKDDGLLLFHISNRYLDLEPITRALALHLGWHAVAISSDDDEALGVYTSTWVVITANEEFLADDEIPEDLLTEDDDIVPLLWTDDFASLWQILEE